MPEPREILKVLGEASERVRSALAGLDEWGLAHTRPGQYRHDLVADEAVLAVLHGSGLSVVSEESGRSGGESELVVVVDPVDGSTNASRGIPWWATSLCAVDDEGPVAAVVTNQVSGMTYEAVRGEGAWRDGEPITPSRCTRLGAAIVGLADFPRRRLGWAQFRAFGASALELCAVADGTIDAFCVPSPGRLFTWDYLGALMVCREAGAVVEDGDGRELVLRNDSTRNPVAAGTPELLTELQAALAG